MSIKTPIELYTTPEAKIDWQTLKLQDFLRKYKVNSENAYLALGKRKRHMHSWFEKNRIAIEKLGIDIVRQLVERWGEAPTARLLLLDVNAIRLHISWKHRNAPSIKKWAQPWVWLI